MRTLPPTRILVVDDSPLDRHRAGRLLQKCLDIDVQYAVDGLDALEQIVIEPPDLVVTDLQMPEKNGLDLVVDLQREYPSIPVILMTARGSEDAAAEALSKGAASYVTKSRLADHLADTVGRVLAAAHDDRKQPRLMHSLVDSSLQFCVQNDLEVVEQLVSHVQAMMRCLPLGGESQRLRVGIAVKHALLAAQYQGNLEIGDVGDENELDQLVQERSVISPFCDRHLHVHAQVNHTRAEFLIRHEGAPFDVDRYQDWSRLTTSDAPLDQGHCLIQTVMDEVVYSEAGDSIRLRKHAVRDDDTFVIDIQEDVSEAEVSDV